MTARLTAWAGFFLALVTYLLTLHLGVPGGDSGELMSAACAGGLAHPPGYPLHGLALRLAAWLPLGDVFVRLNATSAVFGAVTVALIIDTVHRWTKRALAGAVAGALFGASPHVWNAATTTEVFALHGALVALVVWATTCAMESPSPRRWLLVGVSGGLAMTHHPTALFVVLPVLFLARKTWRPVLLGLALGSTPLLLLPLFSAVDTPFSWGDARTAEGFLTHVLRREYGTFRLASRDDGGGGAFALVQAFLRFEVFEVAAVPLLAALLASRFVARRFIIVTVVALTASLVLFGALTNLPLDDALFLQVVQRFFLMPHLVLCLAGAVALAKLPRPVSVGVLVVVLAVGVVRRPRHHTALLTTYGRSVLNLPDDALVLTQGDLVTGVSRAVQACAKEHHSLRVIDQQLMTFSWYVARVGRALTDLHFPGARWHPRDEGAFTLQHFLDANTSRPVFLCGGLKPGDPVPMRLVPYGVCERLVRPNEPFDDEAWWSTSEQLAPNAPVTRSATGTWEAVAERDLWNARARRGLTALEVAIARGDDRQWLERSASILRDAIANDPHPEAATWKNLGIAEGRLGNTSAMKTAFEQYLREAPPDDPQLPSIRALVQ